VDLSKVVLTPLKLKDQGSRTLGLHEDPGEYKLDPLTDPGSGEVQEKNQGAAVGNRGQGQ
jgi:hypothetical protein